MHENEIAKPKFAIGYYYDSWDNNNGTEKITKNSESYRYLPFLCNF